MKKSALPISSPGRVEKYPPPLMRFLIDGGSRSRSRNRSRSRSRSRGGNTSSPMFVRKKNTSSETQEPSSPKVTCMGQVRVRRPTIRGKTGVQVRRRCLWIRAALFCHYKINRKYTTIWHKCVLFFKTSCRRSSEIREDSIRSDAKLESKIEVSEQEGEENGEEDEEGAEVMAEEVASSPSSPPNNALLLTRCRSAPYRSSSLAGRFWSSPLRNSETREEHDGNRETQTPSENPTRRRELNPDEKPSGDPKNGDGERIIRSRGEEERVQEESAHPLILRRCKSEPARTAGKPEPEMNRWRKRKAGPVEETEQQKSNQV